MSTEGSLLAGSSVELTLSSFNNAGMQSSLVVQDSSDQLWSSVISWSSAAWTEHRSLTNSISNQYPHKAVVFLFCFFKPPTSVRRPARAGAKAVVWSSRLRTCSAACLRSPRPGQGKARGRLDVCLWTSDSCKSAWSLWRWHESRRSRTVVNSLMVITGSRLRHYN